VRPNVLRFSGGAPLDREGFRAESNCQKRPDLVGAQRRPLQALVGPERLGRDLAIGCGTQLQVFVRPHVEWLCFFVQKFINPLRKDK
jgi:hypothetical protein